MFWVQFGKKALQALEEGKCGRGLTGDTKDTVMIQEETVRV